MLRIVPATVDMAPGIAARLRTTDYREVVALRGPGVAASLAGDIERSNWSFVALDGVTPLAVWGVAHASMCEGGEAYGILSGVGVPWCLTTPAVERHPRVFARCSRAWVAQMRREFDELVGLCDGRHAKALRWLRWLGFTVDAPRPVNAVPFHRFGMR